MRGVMRMQLIGFGNRVDRAEVHWVRFNFELAGNASTRLHFAAFASSFYNCIVMYSVHFFHILRLFAQCG